MNRHTKRFISGLIFAVAVMACALPSERKGRQGDGNTPDAAHQLPRTPGRRAQEWA